MKARHGGQVTVLALAASLTLGGCGVQSWPVSHGTTGTAAVVDGQRISESDAMTAAEQINEQFKPQQPLTTADAVNLLIVAPAIISETDKLGHPHSAEAARTQLTSISDPADATVRLVQANNALQTVDATSEKAVLAAIRKLTVSVNPRFGTFDAAKPGLVAAAPGWIVKSDR